MDFQGQRIADDETDDAGGDPRPHLIVVGNGMAGCRAIEELIARDAGRYRVTIFGAEPHVNYNRIMLSPVLAGEKTFEQIVINDRAWYDDNRIALVTDDVEAAHATALTAGATELAPPKAMPWGQTVSFIRCPDGTLVELCTPVGG